MFKNLGTLYCDLKNHGQTGERDLPEGVQHVKDLTAKTQKYWQKVTIQFIYKNFHFTILSFFSFTRQ